MLLCLVHIVVLRTVFSLLPTDIGGSLVVVLGGEKLTSCGASWGWHWSAASLHLARSLGILCAPLFCKELTKEEERQGRFLLNC